jgi:ATP-binding cassette subfamily F protein uup
MTSLLSIQNLSKSFGSKPLFEDLSFTISSGDKIGLIGPNGAGKSTLLKILAGLEVQDEGACVKKQGLQIGFASQLPEFKNHSILEALMDQTSPGTYDERLTRAKILAGKAQFSDFSANASLLSGGMKKRLDIARALMHEPDILFLDEPTNHLDLSGIMWLEKFLAKERLTYLLISHDRYFLENCANKIIEINTCYPEGLFISQGGMKAFLEHKEAFLLGQLERQRSLSLTVRDEIDWLRRSPKARTTKSEARVQRANELIQELDFITQRNKKEKVGISFNASERETRKLLTAKNLSKALGGKTLFKGLDLTLTPGTRLGILGGNGDGKTTLLKILSQEISQDMGTIKMCDDLKLVYFDQMREKVPLNCTLREALSPNSDMVNFNGQSIHVNGWAKRFLFYPDRLQLPVSVLSGGERARILIARLMLKPADILFLDEPTNDLDIATLEILEESLKEFKGATVLISHDRCLMERVCTHFIALGMDETPRFFADFHQWNKAWQEIDNKKSIAENTLEKSFKTPVIVKESLKPKKLSFKEQKELEGMEKEILKLEEEILMLQNELAKHDTSKSYSLYKDMAQAQGNLETLYERWQYLENLKST